MKVNIYYGGRGLIEDPTIYVMDKITEVLEELRVEVVRYNLYEEKKSIAMLPKTLKEVDGVILATNVEWFGIGGFMQQFLDACWLYADKEYLSKLYMMPVVLANTIGEKEAELSLIKAWDILGGISCDGICAYVKDHIEFETNKEYMSLIEKKAENLYRTIHQKKTFLPASSAVMKQSIKRVSALDLTPQESEQLSVYVSDDTYVKKQKEDIEELTQMFQGLLKSNNQQEESQLFRALREHFNPQMGGSVSFEITLSDTNQVICVEINEDQLHCSDGAKELADIKIKTTSEVMDKIVEGRLTFQGAFMSGVLSAKGNFQAIHQLDQSFSF